MRLMEFSFYKTHLWDSFGALKLVLTVVCFYLMIEQLYHFSVEKPTFTKETKHEMKVEDFPTFTICPIPEVNFTMTNVNGYLNSYSFVNGILEWKSHPEISWFGNASKSIETVVDDLAIIKSINQCPSFYVSYFSGKG